MTQQNPYASERQRPTAPQCAKSTIGICFTGSHLAISGNGGSRVWGAVSGKPSHNGEFDYSPQRQRLSNNGPIPSGMYWINPSELWENAWYKRDSVISWGNFRITLRVYPGTETYGRGGFFIHGGTSPGSIGCIDLTQNMDEFVRTMRSFVGASNDCYIPVLVKYP
jgi:hypothetical protein